MPGKNLSGVFTFTGCACKTQGLLTGHLHLFLHRLGAWILLLLNFLFIVSWTIVAVSISVSGEEGKRYVFPQVSYI